MDIFKRLGFKKKSTCKDRQISSALKDATNSKDQKKVVSDLNLILSGAVPNCKRTSSQNEYLSIVEDLLELPASDINQVINDCDKKDKENLEEIRKLKQERIDLSRNNSQIRSYLHEASEEMRRLRILNNNLEAENFNLKKDLKRDMEPIIPERFQEKIEEQKSGSPKRNVKITDRLVGLPPSNVLPRRGSRRTSGSPNLD